MMRRSHERRMDPTLSIFYTSPPEKLRQKPSVFPIANSIEIISPGSICYRFDEEDSAKRFLAHLQANPDLIAAGISEAQVKLNNFFVSRKLEHDYSVSLSPHQFDRWLGVDSYNQFMRLKQFDDDKDVDSLLTHLMRLKPALLNQAALLELDQSEWFVTMTAARHLHPDDFISFINDLHVDVCNKSAFFVPAVDGWNAFTAAARYQTTQAFKNYLARLTPDTLQKVMMQQLNDGPNGLEVVARYCGDIDKFMALVDSLGVELCARAALMVNGNVSTLEHISSHVHTTAYIKLLGKIYQDPEAVSKISGAVNHLNTINFHDSGASVDAWSGITRTIISKAPAPKTRPPTENLSAELSARSKRPVWQSDFLHKVRQYGLRFERIQGRTILLKDKGGVILAVKIQKDSELRSELVKEYDTTHYLKQHAEQLRLQSTLPTPLSVTQVSGVLRWLSSHVSPEALQQFSDRIGNNDSRTAYIYKVNPKECDYFTYLHDVVLSDAEYEKANRVAVHDLYTLLGHGVVFPQLADLFHNSEHVDDREDKGRYLVMVNLLRSRGGSGRLTGWKEAVEFPNVRASGLADLGDRASINDYIGYTERVREFYDFAWDQYRDRGANYLFANLMSEYQYVLFLIAGRRGCDLTERARAEGKSEEEIKAIWQKLALQILRNCAQAVAILTHQSENGAEKFLSGVVNIKLLARQMQYWMTNEYIPDVMNNHIPTDVYGEGVRVNVDFDRFREGTFNATYGCSIDGKHPDLGPVNGQEPLKAANELFYWMVNSVYSPYHQLRLAFSDMQNILNERDLFQSEILRKKSFQHLPARQYHAMQLALCNERLKQKKRLPRDVKKEIMREAKTHERSHAALTIFEFWKKHKSGGLNKRPAEAHAEYDAVAPARKKRR